MIVYRICSHHGVFPDIYLKETYAIETAKQIERSKQLKCWVVEERMKNYNCDGSVCRISDGEVRVYPMSDASNLILCRSCWAHENRYQQIRGRWYGREQDFLQHDWAKAEVYNSGE